MGHKDSDLPGWGLILSLVFVLLFSVYASVASAQAPGDPCAAGGPVTMQER